MKRIALVTLRGLGGTGTVARKRTGAFVVLATARGAATNTPANSCLRGARRTAGPSTHADNAPALPEARTRQWIRAPGAAPETMQAWRQRVWFDATRPVSQSSGGSKDGATLAWSW